jgi:hypothetical protein
MNRKALQKVIDELKSDSPRLDYVLGVLETLLESLPNGVAAEVDKAVDKIFQPERPLTEAEILDREAKARLKNIQVTYDN